ncbi:MAG: Fe-S cluster assembly protein SufD [Blastocatellia bacterium]|nr:Fe-S cluster assembly protein SufD [Blastocatellia bacterium]
MTAQTAKEVHYAKAFEAFIGTTGAGELAELRRAAFRYFNETGYPSVRDEDWKYTSVTEVVKSEFNAVDLREMDDHVHPTLKKFNYKRNGFTALNLAFADISERAIPANQKVAEPIQIGTSAVGGAMHAPHYIFVAEPGSEATILEIYESETRSFVNSALQVIVGDNARVTHYRVQKDSAEAFHYGVTEVTLGRDAHYDSTNITLGGAISRHDIDVKFTAEGGEAWVDGLYMLNGSQHHDTHSLIDHAVPNCTSHQTYKGVLNDRSRGVFNGKVLVREDAHGTDAQQSNKNLLLSNEARVDTKPQLEIFNDDVKCSHGATVGQLEEEELFYLLTRGLPENLAKNLLTYGFAEAIIQKIGLDEIKADLDEAVLNRLNVEHGSLRI